MTIRIGWVLLAAAAVAACEGKQKQAVADAGGPEAVVVVAPSPDASVGQLPPAIESFRKADAALQEGKLDEALARAADSTKADPNFLLAWNVLGRAATAKYQQSHDSAWAMKAREAFGRAVKLDPNFLPAWENLGALEEATGRPKEAAEAYARVLALAPEHPARARLTAFVADAGTGVSGEN